MRKIEYDNLRAWRINGIQYVRDNACKERGVVCFRCEAGWMKKSCDHFRQGIEGLRCDDKSIKRD